MTIADLVVGRSDGVVYPNNNLDYKFIKDAKNFCNKRDINRAWCQDVENGRT